MHLPHVPQKASGLLLHAGLTPFIAAAIRSLRLSVKIESQGVGCNVSGTGTGTGKGMGTGTG